MSKLIRRNPKHVFTCPDVIYLQNRQKKIVAFNLIATLLMLVGLWAWAASADKKMDRDLEKAMNENPDNEN